MRTNVHADNTMSLELARALLIYEDDGHHAFVTVHGARVSRGRPHIGPGVAADRAALAGLAQKLANATALSGFLPSTLVYMSPRTIAWWRPAGPARVWFKCPKRADKGVIGTRSAVTPHPALLFTVTGGEHWYIHALAENARPGPEAALRRAPYMNVYERGEICTGNVKLPDRLDPAVLGEYETAFFESRFTHHNDRGSSLTRYKGGIFRLWRDLLDGKHKSFPTSGLGAAAGTLAAHIKKLEEGKHGRD